MAWSQRGEHLGFVALSFFPEPQIQKKKVEPHVLEEETDHLI